MSSSRFWTPANSNQIYIHLRGVCFDRFGFGQFDHFLIEDSSVGIRGEGARRRYRRLARWVHGRAPRIFPPRGLGLASCPIAWTKEIDQGDRSLRYSERSLSASTLTTNAGRGEGIWTPRAFPLYIGTCSLYTIPRPTRQPLDQPWGIKPTSVAAIRYSVRAAASSIDRSNRRRSSQSSIRLRRQDSIVIIPFSGPFSGIVSPHP